MTNLPLSQLGRIVTGKTPKTSRESYFGGGTPFVTPSDMDERRVISETMRTLTDEGVAAVKSSSIPAGSVMVSCIGSDMGKTYLSGKRSVTNQQINTLIVDEKRFSPLFVYYNLLGRRKELREKAAGAAQPILNKTEFGKILVELPTLPEQRKIAAVLSALDDKIELNRKAAATLEEMARALYRSWFVDFDPVWAKVEGRDPARMNAETAALFPDFFGEDGLPTGWKKKPVGEFFKPRIERAGSVRYREYSSSNHGIHPRDEKYKKQLSKDTSKNKIAKKGDFVFGLSRRVLNFGMMQEKIGSFSPAYRIYCVDRGYDFSSFAYEYMKLFPDYFYQAVAASSREGQAISENSLMSLEMLDPPEAILKAHVVLAKPLKDTTQVLAAQNQTLADLRDTLLPRLMSGELRVGEASEQVEDVA